MRFFTKKRVVLFLLFIFPLICFLILSTGENNFKKLPILTQKVIDITEIDASKSVALKESVSIVCFLGNDVQSITSGLLNLNEKVYKKFLDYKKFQIIAIYPKDKTDDVNALKDKIGAFTDMQKWKFVPSTKAEIEGFYQSFAYNEPLINLSSTKAFLIDKNLSLRGRLKDDKTNKKLYGYNLNSVSELNGKLKDDIKVLYYEYYAAFKDRNKNKANRKEVGI
ncbi:hypothetical protein [Polaribacter sp. R77954]|uniref:hypothetical protein n=1 Tax=Polaribacter sp. R77954 TaxID=3093870 RepID=UPI0037C9F10D